jgi:hypothetical protein
MRVTFRIVFQVVQFVVGLSITSVVAHAADGKKVVSSSTSSSGRHGHFFAYAAPVTPDAAGGGLSPFQPNTRLVHFGGGGEATVRSHFGIGTDFGAIPNATHAGTTAVLSVNGYAHALGRDHPYLDPYVTAGYSGFFAPDHKTGGPNLGAGVSWWFRREIGVAVELRQTYGTSEREVRFSVLIWQ